MNAVFLSFLSSKLMLMFIFMRDWGQTVHRARKYVYRCHVIFRYQAMRVYKDKACVGRGIGDSQGETGGKMTDCYE